ncbi:MAG: hypothetical protein HC810_02610 [Acaryochloridaceae cyanobacterium RL_2_7]|nr:hypothetical protein [Acaryochloridaceae cyanobacterium RL_2_7]
MVTHLRKIQDEWPAHQSRLRALAIHPNGRWLASAGHDQEIKLWNLETRDCWRTFRGHQDWIWAVFLPPISNIWSPLGMIIRSSFGT